MKIPSVGSSTKDVHILVQGGLSHLRAKKKTTLKVKEQSTEQETETGRRGDSNRMAVTLREHL